MFEFLNQMLEADGGTNIGGTNEGAPEGATPDAQPESKPLSAEDIQKLIQSETDKIRTEYSKKLKAAEDAKIALEREKMSEAERKAAEQEDLMKQLKEKEQTLLQRELEIKTIDLLKSNELPIEFKPFVTDVSEENVTEKIKSLKKLWAAELKAAVEARFKENGREVTKSTSESGTVTKEQFNKMSYKERVDLFNSNPDLFRELSKF